MDTKVAAMPFLRRTSAVCLGSSVRIKDLETDEELEYTLVEPEFVDPLHDHISTLSPVGRALLDRQVGDVVEVAVPVGTVRYRIIGLRE